jgi:hypothetical protein
MRSRWPWHLSFSPAGAVATLLALALPAPPAAKAECSHLVRSRHDPARLGSLVEPLVRDLAGRSDPPPVSPARRPCSGAWCSEQPGTPAIPPGPFEGWLGTWAWCDANAEGVPTDPSFLVADTDTLRPLGQGDDVFHPPRLVPLI